MNPIRYTLKELKEKTVPIGREGENEYTVVSIDCAEVYEEYPAAVASMKVQNPNKVIYPVVIERSGNDIIWTVKASDLTVKGDGRFQLTFTEGTVIHKTVIGRTLILKSLVGDGPVPEAVEDWIDEATELMEDMEEKRDSGYFKGDPGEPGEPGAPGHSPVLTADKVGKTTTIYSDGTQLAQILDGQDGQAGAIIDDTAPAADKVFSSSKVNGELNTVKSALTLIEEINDDTASPYIYEPSINLFNPAWLTNAGWTYNAETGEYVGTMKQLTTYYTNGAGFPIDFEPNTKYCIYFLARVDAESVIADTNGMTCTVAMTDGNTHSVKVKNNQTTFAEVKASTYAIMTSRSASKIRISYESQGDNVWHIKNLMLVKGYTYIDNLPDYVPYGDTVSLYTANDFIARKELLNKSDNIDRDVLLYRDKIPAYFLAYPGSPSSFSDDNHVDYKISLIPEGKRLLFFTDTHWESNAKHSIPIMQYVRGRKGIKTVLYGGDFIDRRNDKFLAKQTLTDFTSQCLAAFSDGMLTAIGNHDTNLANYSGDSKDDLYLPFTILHKAFFDDIKDKVYTQAQYDYEKIAALTNDPDELAELLAYFSTIYYYDDNKEHIRYIVVNTGNNQSGAVYDIINLSYNQEMRIQWGFVDYALQTVPAGWDVILFGHDFAPIDTSTGVFSWHDEARVMFDMLGRRKTHRDGTITIPTKEILQTWYGGTSYDYDYTNLPDIGKAIVFFGHTHTDAILNTYYNDSGYIRLNQTYDGTALNQSETGKIPLICLTTDAYAQSRTVEQHGVPMEQGTITEQAFDAITIMDGSMKLIRFGAGNDRTVLF